MTTSVLSMTIEPDELSKNKTPKTMRYKVVIRDARQQVVGVPLRGVPRKVAEEMLDPLRWAFDYGYRKAREESQAAPHHVNWGPR